MSKQKDTTFQQKSKNTVDIFAVLRMLFLIVNLSWGILVFIDDFVGIMPFSNFYGTTSFIDALYPSSLFVIYGVIGFILTNDKKKNIVALISFEMFVFILNYFYPFIY